jgi:hypothetical protein
MAHALLLDLTVLESVASADCVESVASAATLVYLP